MKKNFFFNPVREWKTKSKKFRILATLLIIYGVSNILALALYIYGHFNPEIWRLPPGHPGP